MKDIDELKWVGVPSNGSRYYYAKARVPGGWLVKMQATVEAVSTEPYIAMTFVPDPPKEAS